MSDLVVPQPKNSPVHFDQVSSFDQATDYATAGYHAADKKANDTTPVGRLWRDAAISYYSAYVAMVGLRVQPNDAGLPKAKEMLMEANHKSDVAAASK